MWRWLVPYGLTAVAVTILVSVEQPYVPWTDLFPRADAYRMGALTTAWFAFMVWSSATILYYRLLIFAGERAVRRRPLIGAILFLLAGALVPPLVQNGLAFRAIGARNFTGPAPGGADIVVIEGSDGASGSTHCGQTCARLLFGGGARQVLLAAPGGAADAPALRLEQRPTCPPVPDQDLPGRRADSPTLSLQWPERETGDRILAQIASGRCLVAARGRVDAAGLKLGWGWMRPRQAPVRDGFGLNDGDFRFVERRENGQWTRLSQRMGQSLTFHWVAPFAVRPTRQGWIAGLIRYRFDDDARTSNPQPWRWAGLTLPEVPDLGWQRVREMLRAAVALPANAPRDARHQLARQYLAALSTRPADDLDRALLHRLPGDPRIEKGDLRGLEQTLAHIRGEPTQPRANEGAVAPFGEDLGPLGTRKYAAFAADLGMLLALHLIALLIARQISRSRKTARLRAAEPPAST